MSTYGRKWRLFTLMAIAALVAALTTMPAFAGGKQGPPEDLKVQARPVFEIQGVVYTDAKESGLVEIGVDNKGRARAVEAKLKQLGIPLSSVEIVVTKPIVFATTLQDYERPLEGGLQVAFVDGGLAFLCTLGFNAVRDGVNGFLVNSHCTTEKFEDDGTNHYQPWLSPASNLIGTEIADPPTFKCNVRGKKCRYSDAAYDELAGGVQATLGSIARPDGMNNGSLTIDGDFSIVGELAGNAAVGTTLNKVGRTTGWSQGLVTNSCVDTGVFGTNHLLLCQDFVGAEVGGGDSGSPVFEIVSGTDVTLSGILWGGTSDGSMFVYSPIANIEMASELGPLTTFGESPTDTTAPVISSVTATDITDNSATITWTTDEPADSRVDYGTDHTYGSMATDTNLVTNHSVSLTGLSAATDYHFFVTSADGWNNSASSGDSHFTTAAADTTAPVISGVTATDITYNSATITWTTDEPADSRVDYGTDHTYGSMATDTNLVTNHSVSLTGLSAATDYHFFVTSADGSNNSASSGDLHFTTPAPGGTFSLTVSYATEGGKDGLKHLLVTFAADDGVNPVSDVTFSHTLNNTAADQSWGPVTGTTGGGGTVTFSLKNAPSGTYSVTVHWATHDPLTWDEVQPTDTLTK